MKKFTLTFLFIVVLHAAKIFAQVPIISIFSPISGTPGQTVNIWGSNFNDTAANNIVFFGKVKATVVSASATFLTVTIPFGATLAPISVTVNYLTGRSVQYFTPTFAGNSQALTAANFSAPISYSFPVQNELVLADFDGDGKLDIITKGESIPGTTYAFNDEFVIYRNINTPGQPLTSASFAAPFYIAGDTYSNFKIADMDGDGKLDILAEGSLVTGSGIVKNTSTPGSISFAFWFSFRFGPADFADIDGDGKVDYLCITWKGAGPYLINAYRNISTPFTGAFNSYADNPIRIVPNNYNTISLRDINGDNKPELFIGIKNSDTVLVYPNATISPGIIIDSNTYPASVVFKGARNEYKHRFADFDGDGNLDWLAMGYFLPNYFSTSQRTPLTFFRNNTGASTINSSYFNAPYSDSTNNPYQYSDIDVGDLNGDGKPDVVASVFLNSTTVLGSIGIRALTNISTPGIINSTSFIDSNIVAYAASTGYKNIVIGDLDQDSRPEIVYSTGNHASIGVIRNITPIVKPTGQPTSIYVSQISTTSMQLNWTNGNGAGRIVLAKAVSVITDTPTSYSVYAASSVFGSGSLIGTATRVVYIGNGNSVTITGLTPGVQYRFAIFEFNGPTTSMNFMTTTPGTVSGTTLPVKLISFNGDNNNGNVELKWQTASELNNDRFEIERSMGNGQSSFIGTVKGSGTTNILSNYTYVDEEAFNKTNADKLYYRLKQVDVDGKSEYSQTVIVSDKKTHETMLRIIPNPNNGIFTVELSNNKFSDQHITITNLLGEIVYQATVHNQSTEIDLQQVNKGMYFLKSEGEQGCFVQKVLVR